MEPKGNCGLKIYLRKFDDYMEMFSIGLILETPFFVFEGKFVLKLWNTAESKLVS